MANPVVQSKSNQVFTFSNTVTVTKPSGTTDGDFLVAFISFFNGNETITGVPSGWSLLIDEYSGNSGLGIYTKTAGGSEPTDYSWTVSGSNEVCSGAVFRIDGQAVGNEVAGQQIVYQGTGDTDMTETVSVTPDTSESLVLLCFYVEAVTGTTSTVSGYASTPSVTYTEEYDMTYTPGSSYATMAIASGDYDGSTTFTSIGATNSNTPDNYRSAIVVINAPEDATNSVAALQIDSTMSATVSGDSNQTVTPLVFDSTMPDADGVVTEKPWTPRTKGSGSWTPRNK